jgi:hypothetical protein
MNCFTWRRKLKLTVFYCKLVPCLEFIYIFKESLLCMVNKMKYEIVIYYFIVNRLIHSTT